ncbi:hypothetical protein E2986_13987 [Frieseomelitta varia]|uniref:Uncharacterized protein n=1 Tax=Frieseomelitta varia TaxID=561572 RepID=A0A833RXE3_9HYME|nr:hypothetical protein E2986_13987 [Frieseomelitta varia]
MSRGEALADSAENPSLWRQAKVSLQCRANRAEPRRGEANRTNRTNRAKRRGYKSVVRSLTAGGHRSASIQGQPLRRLAISFSLSLSLSFSPSFFPILSFSLCPPPPVRSLFLVPLVVSVPSEKAY